MPLLYPTIGLALLAAVGFGGYFLPMHAAGKVDFWWSTLVFRTTTLLLVGSAVAVSRPVLRMRPRDLVIQHPDFGIPW